MKLRLTFEITETEDQARELCDRENAAHPRRKNKAHYTPWNHPKEPGKFIAWYYA